MTCTKPGKAPVIISASRAMNVPAFHSEWFMNRLRKGHVDWSNPFNGKKSRVSFENMKVVVFWSKNPKPMFPHLKELDDRGIHYYFQFALNDYEKEGFEPNVPALAERTKTFRHLSKLIGKEKVIWRFDPLIASPQLTPRDLLGKIQHIGDQLKGYTATLVFSFVDVEIYRNKVKNSLVKCCPTLYSGDSVVKEAELSKEQQLEVAEGLVEIRGRWKSEGWDIVMAICAEEIDLGKYEIEHNRCIDAELMQRIFPDDKELRCFLSKHNEKDRGQRKRCGCMTSKDIGIYNTCRHYCVYCYANTSKEAVENKLKDLSPG